MRALIASDREAFYATEIKPVKKSTIRQLDG